ncbi:trehalose-phosphatase [Glutamicibacter sp. JC586]|uniref:trehalose-phosphatase n=1 Tax=Glutamicibacter sp. JC586 TaxID=2590552 RepID=UPI00135A634C|nr:trehalose-phosphatase [Glutamicibacter sp. JC586]
MTTRMDVALSEINADLHTALATFAAHEQILVALDFDGTMSPLVDRPEDARPLPASALAFETLSQQPGVHTALVSGRNLASLAAVYPEPMPQICIGSHGAERRLPESLRAHWDDQPLTMVQSERLKSLSQALEMVAKTHENVTLEYKPSATVLHVRRATREVGISAIAEAKHALNSIHGVKLLEGKSVLEASVHQGDKGESLTWLRELLQVDAVLFVGDDVTDENGFKVLTPADLGVKVGSGTTLARHRIGSPQDLPDLLQFLISVRN